MPAQQCPRCQKPLSGQVKLCSLCGTTYHSGCLKDTRDCLFCVTKGGLPSRMVDDDARSTKRVLMVLVGVAVTLLVILLLVWRAWAPAATSDARPGQTLEAGADLDAVRMAVQAYEGRPGQAPLAGTSLGPLVGPLLPRAPTDPWGRPYLVDAGLGLLACYGRDGRAGGAGLDGDVLRRYRRPATLTAARWRAPSGPTLGTARLQLEFDRPVDVLDARALLGALRFVRGPACGPSRSPMALCDTPGAWALADGEAGHDPARGLLLFRPTADLPLGPGRDLVEPGASAVNLDLTASASGLLERPSPATPGSPSPFDGERFGPDAARNLRAPQAKAPLAGRDEGVTVAGEPRV